MWVGKNGSDFRINGSQEELTDLRVAISEAMVNGIGKLVIEDRHELVIVVREEANE